MRSWTMLSMMPCIATLVKLEQVGGGFSGRVLLQNDLSVGYWGHLDKLSDTGVLWMWVGGCGWVWGCTLIHAHAHPTRDCLPP